MLSILTGMTFAGHEVRAAGLDVQLKDLRGAFYFTDKDVTKEASAASVETTKNSATCTKLISSEIKKFGRLTHCKPSEAYVECHPKGGEKLFIYEQEESCKSALKKGVAPSPEE